MNKNSLKFLDFVSKEFKNGLEAASKSFNILWRNKKLLLYFGVTLLVFAIIETLVYNIQKCSISGCISPMIQDLPENVATILKKIGASDNWIKYSIVLFISLTHMITITIAKMAITFHTSNIQKKEHLNFKQAANIFMPKIKNGIIWTAFILIPITTFTIISALSQNHQPTLISFFYTTIIFSISILWSLVSAFVIQAITIENLGVLNAIKRSINVIRKIFFEYLGAMFWIALIGSICSLPFVFLEKLINKATYNYVTIAIILIIYSAITSSYEVSKTLLFNNFKQKHS